MTTTDTGPLERWVDKGHVERWFRLIEWTGLTTALFVAATFVDNVAGMLLIFVVAVVSFCQCYMVATVSLVRPIISFANSKRKSQAKQTGLFLILVVTLFAVLALIITFLTLAALSAIAQAKA